MSDSATLSPRMQPDRDNPSTSDVLRRATRATLRVLLAGLAGHALAATLRYGLIERDGIGIACESGAADWRCDLRMLVIQAFLHHAFAIAAVAAAAVALWSRRAAPAGIAIAAGVVGMVLYDFEWSVPGALAGIVALARLEHERREQREGQHQH